MRMRCMAVNKVLGKFCYKLFEENLLKRYVYVLIALFVSAISYNLLMYPAKIVAGGANGLSIIMQTLFNIKPSAFILFFSTIILIIAVVTLGVEKSSGALLATFVYPIFVDLTAGITTILSVNESDLILISLFSGILCGGASGIIYKMGFSSGGISLISQMIYEKFHISVSKSSFCINLIIVAAGGLLYGIETIMYAIILLFVNSVVINRVLLGISKNKMFLIVTMEEEKVRNFLLNHIGHGITEFEVVSDNKDKNKNKNKKALMTVVPTKDYFKITKHIKLIDEAVFFVVVDSYQMSNGS